MGFSIHEAFPYRFQGFSVDFRGLSVDQGFSVGVSSISAFRGIIGAMFDLSAPAQIMDFYDFFAVFNGFLMVFLWAFLRGFFP